MLSENHPSTQCVKVLHLDYDGRTAIDASGRTEPYDLLRKLYGAKIKQQLIVTGSNDKSHKACIKKNTHSHHAIETLFLLNSSCGVNLPRNEMMSKQVEGCIRGVVRDFNPDLVHIHHVNGFSASSIECLKTRFDMPVVITLNDYWYLCPTSQLINYKGEHCKDTAHGDNCVQCYKSQASWHEYTPDYAIWPGEFESRKAAWIRALNTADRIISLSPDLNAIYVRNGIDPHRISLIPTGDQKQLDEMAYAKQIGGLYQELVVGKIKCHGKKIELGGGETPKQKNRGYLNLDFRAIPEVDLVADVKRIPFGGRTIDHLFAANLVEHFPRKEIHRILLEWWRSLKQGGYLDIMVPDLEGTLDNWRNMPFHRVLDALYGAQKFDGDYHFNGLTVASLKKLLLLSGFRAFPISLHYNLMDVPRIFLRAQKKTKIRIFPFGDATKGSSRLRVHNVYPHLVNLGYDVHLFGDPADCDVAIFQKVFDQDLVAKCRGVTILDVDDNFFEFTNSADACKRISNNVSAVVTSTAALKNIAHKYGNPKIEIIPTSIDLFKSTIEPPKKKCNTIKLAGWVGNPENLHYLDEILPHLRQANIKLRIITNVSHVDPRWFKQNQKHIELFEWTIEGADDLLRVCDIGLAPLKQDAWSTSKSAVKILKYWAVGIPVICSPIPEYERIASEFGVSCIAHDNEDWVQMLNRSPEENVQQVKRAQKGLGAYMASAVAHQWDDLIARLVYEQQLKAGANGFHEKS